MAGVREKLGEGSAGRWNKEGSRDGVSVAIVTHLGWHTVNQRVRSRTLTCLKNARVVMRPFLLAFS